MNRPFSLPLTSLLVLTFLGAACSDIDRSTPAPLNGRALEKVGSQRLPCEDGATKTCNLTLAEHEGVVSCYEGLRHCRLGNWEQCTDGREYSFQRTETPWGSINFKSFNNPNECTDNPCNAYCREFLEAPSEGIVADIDPDGVVEVQVLVGDLGDYSETLVAEGNTEPCQDAADCQFNNRCIDPGVGSCNHSVCSAGDALDPDCNRCVTTVCKSAPECCGPVVQCAHDPCQTGVALEASCDTCTQAICDVHPECCDSGVANAWDAACVGYVATQCAPQGQSCGCPSNGIELDGVCYAPNETITGWSSALTCPGLGNGWRLAEPQSAEENAVAQSIAATLPGAIGWLGARDVSNDLATPGQWAWDSDSTTDPFFVGDSDGSLQPGHDFENWATGKPSAGSALDATTIDDLGQWNHSSKSTPLPSVCVGPADTLNPTFPALQWDDTCVALAKSECGVSCSEGAPIGLGACVAQVQSRLDAACPGYDLAVGATCSDTSVPQIPVCNHGQTESPAGLVIRYYSGNALVTQLDPDPVLGTDCTLDEAIAPGRCIIVDDCIGIAVGDAVVVNPRANEDDESECLFEDNWSIYDDVACSAPLCESSAHSASQVAQLDCSVAIEHPLSLATDDARVTLATGIVEPGCGADEQMWGSSCYHFSPSPANWLDARDLCQSRGSDWNLIAINSPQENAFAREGFGIGFNDEFHIGLNDIAVNRVFVWANGSCTAYENWSPDDSSNPTGKGPQPNELPAGANGCTRMFRDNAWGDTACTPASFQYVCEGPVRDPQGGCESGQFTGPDGDCYFVNERLMDQATADADCRSIGTGWGLAHIRNHAVNEFALSLTGCDPVWLNTLSDNFSSDFLLADILPGSADFGDDASIDALGAWKLSPPGNGDEKFALCQGPSISIGTPPLVQVANALGCTNDSTRQYYLNGDFFGGTAPENFTPERLELCPTTCEAAKLEPGNTRLDVDIPCAPPVPPSLPTVHDIFYKSDCLEGGNQWDFLYYDAITPANSRIEFFVRTGTDKASIDSDNDPFIAVASAHAVPEDTQRCEVDPPNCPIDLFNLLGNPGFQRKALQLQIRMIPGTNGEGPVLRDWKVRFSCPPSE